MLLISFEAGAPAQRSWGIQGSGFVIDLPRLGQLRHTPFPSTLYDAVRLGPAFLIWLKARLAASGAQALNAATVPLAETRILAPFRPGKIVCAGLNYPAHVAEASRALDAKGGRPDRPVLFSKPATAVIGPDEPILLDPRLTSQLDWECELAVIIGRTARHVAPANALGHVFGYSIINDISARDQRRGGQLFFSKGQDSYAPFGPAIRTADELTDPQSVRLMLSVNGTKKQDGDAAAMLFSVVDLIVDITSGMTLEPGDVVSTGSPEGVGAAQDPPQFLRPGDLVEASIDAVGTLRNPVIAI